MTWTRYVRPSAMAFAALAAAGCAAWCAWCVAIIVCAGEDLARRDRPCP